MNQPLTNLLRILVSEDMEREVKRAALTETAKQERPVGVSEWVRVQIAKGLESAK